MEDESTRHQRQRRKDKMVKMRSVQGTSQEHFFDDDQETANIEPEDTLLEEVGNGDEDDEYIPEND